ncbi:squamosa promoter-binding-like protein 3 [Phtheirospermum japonicum]|uniref:Squamosa promoter-binding-like protein 3 n=1 Tax=Phtheirospermum japonicum TaxID=374723 RepID=A0A830B9T7_9LAMI|nr:squamosa promoter-binding-like protein 3 [Phtheirospermum japonicum]
MQNPCCQVEGCNLDLKSAKDYHRRHRICEGHSKSPKVIVAGMERRFCQQCSKFHDLSEFDDKKRSCRRRLSDHNARRRRVQPESVHLGPAGLSSALYGVFLLTLKYYQKIKINEASGYCCPLLFPSFLVES